MAPWLGIVLLIMCIWLDTCDSTAAYMLKYLGKGHRQPCTLDSDPCNPVKFLTCTQGMCLCAAGPEMVYDEQRDHCAALASYSCLRSMPDSNSVQSPKYQVACVQNAKCIFPGDTCQCDHRYFEAEDHTCIRQYDYGAACSKDEQCDQFRFFSCLGGRCGCDPDKNHRYDARRDTCMVSVGTKCRVIEFMSISEEHFKTDECPEHATCTDGICKCNTGYRITNDKTCGRILGDSCDAEDNKCSDISFTCRNQECQCKYPLHQVIEGGDCISLVSGPCTTERESRLVDDPHFIQNCTENASCQESQAFNYCKCKDGYVETNEGRCSRAYGSSCKRDDECDSLAQLACICHGDCKCGCPDSLQTYDDKSRRCVGLAGSRCWKDNNTTSAVCTNNAYCVKSNPQLSYGKCICARGFATTQQKSCVKAN